MGRSPFRQYVSIFGLIFTTGLLLASCNLLRAKPTSDASDTNAAETAAVGLTRAAQPEPSASQTPSPSAATQLPQASPTPAPASATQKPGGCTDRATFITDVTVPDNTNLGSGENFTKSWRLENAGTCTWTRAYELAFDRGDQLNAPNSLPLPGRVQPGQQINLSVDMRSPAGNGTFQGYWKLRNDDGVLFGIGDDADVAFWVRIVVGPTATATPEVYTTKTGTVSSSYLVDLDEGNFRPTSSTRDLWYEAITSTERYFTPRNGATIAVWDNGTPSHEECEGAGLSGIRISFEDFSEGDWICFETNEGRLGRFEIENIVSGGNPDVRIAILTWE